VCSIFVTQYFVFNDWSCAATISLSASAFKSPFDNQRNVYFSLISYLSIFLTYCPCITLFFHFVFKVYPNLHFVCCISSCFASFIRLSWYTSSIIFDADLSIESIFGCVLSWTVTILTNWSSLYFVLRCSAVLIISVLYAASTCTLCPTKIHRSGIF
jgi:hypothetical protein